MQEIIHTVMWSRVEFSNKHPPLSNQEIFFSFSAEGYLPPLLKKMNSI